MKNLEEKLGTSFESKRKFKIIRDAFFYGTVTLPVIGTILSHSLYEMSQAPMDYTEVPLKYLPGPYIVGVFGGLISLIVCEVITSAEKYYKKKTKKNIECDLLFDV